MPYNQEKRLYTRDKTRDFVISIRKASKSMPCWIPQRMTFKQNGQSSDDLHRLYWAQRRAFQKAEELVERGRPFAT